MIDKYAEISDRVLLYNALKGILRVKQAAKGNIPLRLATGFDLAIGHNGVKDTPILDSDGNNVGTQYEAYSPSWKSRGRQALAIGSIGGGALAGGAAGYYGGRVLADATGLSDSDSAFARGVGYALRGGGALAGGLLGGAGGSLLASYLADGKNGDTAWADKRQKALDDQNAYFNTISNPATASELTKALDAANRSRKLAITPW